MPDDPDREYPDRDRRDDEKRYAGHNTENLGEDSWRDPVDADAQIAYQRGGSSMEVQQRRLPIKLHDRESTIQIAEDDQPAPASDLGSSSAHPRLRVVKACQPTRPPIPDRQAPEGAHGQCEVNAPAHPR